MQKKIQKTTKTQTKKKTTEKIQTNKQTNPSNQSQHLLKKILWCWRKYKNIVSSGQTKFNTTSCPLCQNTALSTEVISLLKFPIKALTLVAILGVFPAPEYTIVQQCQIHWTSPQDSSIPKGGSFYIKRALFLHSTFGIHSTSLLVSETLEFS